VAPDLRRRLLTAAVALPPALALIWLGGWPAAALFSAGSGLATWEFLRLGVGRTRLRDAATLGGAVLLPWLPLWAPGSASAIALLLVALSSVWAWGWHAARQDVERAATDAPLTVEALVFCALGPFFLAMLRAGPDGRAWTLTVLMATFANDAAAYGLGKAFGRRRIAPRVSPGKSWEGFAGGFLGALAAVAFAMLLWPRAFRLLDAAVIGLVCSVVGPVGDLAKSLLKRARQVKDAGGLLPGHGGMLDRIDALIVNAPAVWAWAEWGR
jgi:phosphatidate cytidylyltransferase